MPLGSNVSANMKEMYKDNKKSGKAKGAGGKARSRAQMIAISMHAAGRDQMPTLAMKARAAKMKSKKMPPKGMMAKA